MTKVANYLHITGESHQIFNAKFYMFSVCIFKKMVYSYTNCTRAPQNNNNKKKTQ